MEVRDQVYCFEIARRAVGRAAIYLGIESMTEESLDVMADILLTYLTRVGNTLSHLVESSGRSSAHVHILDAFQAVQVVTSPAVQRLHLITDDDQFGAAGTTSAAAASAAATGSGSGRGGSSNSGGGTGSSGSNNNSRQNNKFSNQISKPNWQGLAAFCLGPNWYEKLKEEDTINGQNKDDNGTGTGSAAGGKRGPSSTTTSSSGDPLLLSTQQKKNTDGGWEAPYLDEVPHFPQAGESCANPHPLPPHVGLSLHNASQAQMHVLQQPLHDNSNNTYDDDDIMNDEDLMGTIPDPVFTWGSLNNIGQTMNGNSNIANGNKKRDRDKKNNDDDDKMNVDGTNSSTPNSPPLKKVKLDDGSGNKTGPSSSTAGTDPNKGGPGSSDSNDKKGNDQKKNSTTGSGKSGGSGGKSGTTDDNTKDDDKKNKSNTSKKGGTNSNKKRKIDSSTGGGSGTGGTSSSIGGGDLNNSTNTDGDNPLDINEQYLLQKNLPPYTPTFYPPAPRMVHTAEGRAVVDTLLETSNTRVDGTGPAGTGDGIGGTTDLDDLESSLNKTNNNKQTSSSEQLVHGVRSSLVELGSYWGSGWEATPKSKSSISTLEQQQNISVPLGRTDGGDTSTSIIPLGRASGSRVSKIIEGSMDAAAMQ